MLEAQNIGHYQEVLAWGWLAWSSCTDSGMMPQYCEAIGELGVAQIVCAERCLLILTNAGKVFTVYYSSETQVRFISSITFKYRE
jgi:E3 ubiquitin-protein ligase HERC2